MCLFLVILGTHPTLVLVAGILPGGSQLLLDDSIFYRPPRGGEPVPLPLRLTVTYFTCFSTFPEEHLGALFPSIVSSPVVLGLGVFRSQQLLPQAFYLFLFSCCFFFVYLFFFFSQPFGSAFARSPVSLIAFRVHDLMANLKLVTINVNGLGGAVKRRAIFNSIKEQKSEIIFLQETHSTPGQEKIWSSEWGGKAYFSHGSSSARGVAILLPPSSPIRVLSSKRDEEGRFLFLQASIDGWEFALLNIYAPTAD